MYLPAKVVETKGIYRKIVLICLILMMGMANLFLPNSPHEPASSTSTAPPQTLGGYVFFVPDENVPAIGVLGIPLTHGLPHSCGGIFEPPCAWFTD